MNIINLNEVPNESRYSQEKIDRTIDILRLEPNRARVVRSSLSLTHLDMALIDAWQSLRLHEFCRVAPEGEWKNYENAFGKTVKYWDYKTVFQPTHDADGLEKQISKLGLDGEFLLDVGTGMGRLAITAAERGAVALGVDINEYDLVAARKTATERRAIINFRKSDVYDQVIGRRYDYIIANLPFRPDKPGFLLDGEKLGLSEEELAFLWRNIWDEGFSAHNRLVKGLCNRLTAGGTAYASQSNFGGTVELVQLCHECGCLVKLIDYNPMKELNPNDPRVFFTFEIKPKEYA